MGFEQLRMFSNMDGNTVLFILTFLLNLIFWNHFHQKTFWNTKYQYLPFELANEHSEKLRLVVCLHQSFCIEEVHPLYKAIKIVKIWKFHYSTLNNLEHSCINCCQSHDVIDIVCNFFLFRSVTPVSYTHLDVYKRQLQSQLGL